MDEIFSSKTYQERYLDRHVNIKVGDTEKTSFEEFIHDDSLNITVRSDYKNKNLQINDTHLNHKGNQIFANSIIEKLQQDNFKI
jgi:lysophospholipase L1-like esterase